MNPELLNITMHDGSRQFASLPHSREWDDLRDHLARLPGAKITEFLTDHVTEAWIDFSYQGHSFTVNNQFGEYWFFVQKPDCPNVILSEVVAHCQEFLTKPRTARWLIAKLLGGVATVGLGSALLTLVRDTPPGGGPPAPLQTAILPGLIGISGIGLFAYAEMRLRILAGRPIKNYWRTVAIIAGTGVGAAAVALYFLHD